MTTVAASIALVTTTPIWTALAARIAGVRLPAAVWWGLALAVRRRRADRRGGRHRQPARRWPGTGWPCSGAIAAGGYVLAGARARERLATSAYTVVCYSTCAVVLAVAALIVGVPLGGFSARDWWLIAAITFVAQLLGHTLLNLVLLLGRADGRQPRRPAGGAGLADRRAGPAGPGAAAAGAARHGRRRRRGRARGAGQPPGDAGRAGHLRGLDHSARGRPAADAVATLR